MTTYCYGRFRVPHMGHSLLFDKADIVLVSQSPSPFHRELLKDYAGKPVINIPAGTLLGWLQRNGCDSDDAVVLGEDNVKLAQLVTELGVGVIVVPRDKLLSSTELRRQLVQANGDIAKTSHMHRSWSQCRIAAELWAQGY